jgi:hypothetical protein
MRDSRKIPRKEMEKEMEKLKNKSISSNQRKKKKIEEVQKILIHLFTP